MYAFEIKMNRKFLLENFFIKKMNSLIFINDCFQIITCMEEFNEHRNGDSQPIGMQREYCYEFIFLFLIDLRMIFQYIWLTKTAIFKVKNSFSSVNYYFSYCASGFFSHLNHH